MKKMLYAAIAVLAVCALLSGCASKNENAGTKPSLGAQQSETPRREITKEMAYEGVYNYCRSAYDWSAAEENPSIMYVETGEESETAYQVIFRSYTGALVYFYVDKSTGTTSMTEYVPALDIKNEVGSFQLDDYLKRQDEAGGAGRT